jgi:lipocalin
MRASFLLLATLSVSGASTTQRLKLPPLQVVEKVDLQRYLGTW